MLSSFTTLSETDRRSSLWLYFDSFMSNFKPFERGTKSQDYKRVIKKSNKSQPTCPPRLEY